MRASYCSQELNDLLDNKEHRLERASSEPDSSKTQRSATFFIDPQSALTAPAPKLTRLTLAHHSCASGTRVKAKTKTSRSPHTRLPASQFSR